MFGYEYEMSNQACGSEKCEITKIPSARRSRPSIPSSPDSNYYTVGWWMADRNIVLGENNKYGKKSNTDSTRWDLGFLEVNGDNVAVSVSDKYST